MAPRSKKERICVVVDVNPTMHQDLPAVSGALTEFFHKKVLFGSAGETQSAILLSGSDKTENELNLENEQQGNSDQYLNQQILLPMGAVTREEVMAAAQLALYAGENSSNFLDALSVAQHALVNGRNEKKDEALRIIFVSDLLSDQTDRANPDDAEFLSSLSQGLASYNIQLHTYFIPRPGVVPPVAAREALRKLTANVHGEWTEAPASADMFPTPIVKPVKPAQTVSSLDLGPWLTVPVWVFKAVDEAKTPSLKLYYPGTGEGNEEHLTHVIERRTEYMRKDDMESGNFVTSDQRMPAYRYGPTMVPMSSAELKSMQFKPGPLAEDGSTFKGIQLLGFVEADELPPHLNIKTADYIMPHPQKSHPSGLWNSGGTDAVTAARSAAAVSALARALDEKKSVAIVRYVLRKGGDLRLGALSPVLSPRGDYLMLNTLPFAEDMREYEFAPLDANPRLVPSAEAEAAALRLVDAMTFGVAPAPAGDAFAATGDWRCVQNPTLKRFYDFIKRRAIVTDPLAEAPPLEPWEAGLLPHALTSPDAEAAAAAFVAAAPTRAPPPRKRAARDAIGAAAQEGAPEGAAAGEPDSKRAREPAGPHFDDKNPVPDFEREIAAAAGDFEKTMNVMHAFKKLVADILDTYGPERWPDVISCTAALRRACLEAQMPATFEAFLHLLFEKGRGCTAGGVWGAAQAANVLPITADEVPSDPAAMSAAAAAEYMARDAEIAVLEAPKQEKEEAQAEGAEAADEGEFEDMD